MKISLSQSFLITIIFCFHLPSQARFLKEQTQNANFLKSIHNPHHIEVRLGLLPGLRLLW